MLAKTNISKASFNWGPWLALLVVGSWAIVHIYSVFIHDLTAAIWMTLGLIALQCWLYTGLFIIAHDTMHGSFTPHNAKLNAIIGTVILFIYAGFSWKNMREAHHAHHDYPGTKDDPDFNVDDPVRFWPWYVKFFTQYFQWPQLLVLSGFTAIYIFVFNANYLNTIIMWALPAVLSSVQLFYFGTFLTHRHKEVFIDAHNARSNDYPKWLSLLTCFHFGYHHEHHLYPHEPWWRLPTRKFEGHKT